MGDLFLWCISFGFFLMVWSQCIRKIFNVDIIFFPLYCKERVINKPDVFDRFHPYRTTAERRKKLSTAGDG